MGLPLVPTDEKLFRSSSVLRKIRGIACLSRHAVAEQYPRNVVYSC